MRADLVYALGPESGWGEHEELRYSIRSAVANFKDLGDVYVVGHKPRWLTHPQQGGHRLVHIPHIDPYKSNKDANIITKVIRACLEQDLSEIFIFMLDDTAFLQPITAADMKDPWRLEDLVNFTNWGSSKWQQRLRKTRDELVARGLPAFNCDAHIPALMHKEHFPKKMLEYNYGEGNGYTINTLYFNSLSGYKPRKLTPDIRAGFYSSKPVTIANQVFLNYNDQGLTQELRSWLQKRFPVKTLFEK